MNAYAKQHRYIADFSLALINRTGAYYVCRDILGHLPEYFVATRYWRSFLAKEPTGLIRRLLGRAMLFELNHLRLGDRVSRPCGDAATLFFDPLYVMPVSLTERDIVLCHDVGPVTNPELFDLKTTALYGAAYRKIQQAKPGMVFVSEASRTDFISRYGDEFRFLKVIPLYVRSGTDFGEGKAPLEIETPFLLTVAALETRKNHRRTIEAFCRSGLRERGYSYVLCGPRGNSAREVEAIARSTPGVRALGYRSDTELRWLYSNAAGFILPSLLEGFGLPALEAGRHGLVPVISAEGAQAEAVGEGAIMVDPTSADAIAKGMRQVVDMPEEDRCKRVTLIRQRAAALSLKHYIARWSELLASAHEISA
jgi:glycosyltransferase involved in cell wall biosynthesis